MSAAAMPNGQDITGETYRPWTTAELKTLREQAHLGARQLAALLDRTERSIRNAAHRHRISLRRPGERRGLILGQPRDTGWDELREVGVSVRRLHELRAAALAGDVDLTELHTRAAAADGPLCPRCCRRPQHRRHGVCVPCHIRALAAAHDDVAAENGARRELDAAKQRSSRARRRRRP